MRHRNQLNLVKLRQLRSARLPAIGPVGDEGNNRVARLYARPDSSCARCGYLRCDGHPKKDAPLAKPEPKQTPFVAGDVVKDGAGTERIVVRCFKRNAPGGSGHNDWLFHDAEYARNEEGKGDAAHGYFVDRFELVRRAGEVKQAVTLPAGWRYISAQTASGFALEGYEAYEHVTGAAVYLNGATWVVFAKGGDSSTRDARLVRKAPTMTVTLGEALPAEMKRVRDEVMPLYIEIGAPGRYALTMMRADLDEAARALAEGDVAAMMVVYESLKGYTT